MKFEFSWQIFEKYNNVKFNENLSEWEGGCSIWTDRQMDGQIYKETERQTNLMKLAVAIRNFANMRINGHYYSTTCRFSRNILCIWIVINRLSNLKL
jgi:hypothetical protein